MMFLQAFLTHYVKCGIIISVFYIKIFEQGRLLHNYTRDTILREALLLVKNSNTNPFCPSANDLSIVRISLTNALVEETCIQDAVLNFAIGLTNQETPNSPFISRLSSEMRQSAKFRTALRTENPNVLEEIGIAISIILEELFPDIKFSIAGREKTFFSEVNKRISKMLEGKSPQIQDLLALRVIILNQDNEKENITRCYQVFNAILAHFSLYNPIIDTGLSWDISVKEVLPLKDNRASIAKKFPSLYLPDSSGLDFTFKNMVKDYIFYPNLDGYQGLHLVLTYKGIPMEIQIRTVNMHHWAEHGPAKHSDYKKKKLFQDISLEMFDEASISCPKYELYGDELITYPGLVNAIPFFRYSN